MVLKAAMEIFVILLPMLNKKALILNCILLVLD